MESSTTFNAPWERFLKGMTGSAVFILIGVPILVVFRGPQDRIGWFMGVVLPLLILFVGSFFTIRGYVLTKDALFVQRLGWNSKVDLAGLNSAEADPKAMTRPIRTFGNGGLFCFAGYFRSKKLGSYRAFATDPKRSVVLKFPNRTIVVTPEEPEEFVAKIKELRDL